MGVIKHKGFTIIEVVLFLGVTGLVMGVLLTGVGSSLSRERYRDAANSFQDYLQGQYNLVANVNNSRTSTDVCKGGTIVSDGSATDQGRGTSDCTIVGRVIYSTDDGMSVESAQVYATVDASTLTGSVDTDVLKAAQLVANPTTESYSIGWSTKIVAPRPNDSVAAFSILIVRMPTSGLVHTYALAQSRQAPASLIGQQIPTGGLHLCVDNSGLITNSVGRVGSIIMPDAVNSSGVQFASESSC